MGEQVVTKNLSDAEIAAIISSSNADTEIKIYELLPQFIRDQDPDKVVRGFCEAVQAEYDRCKSSITEIIAVIDPQAVNKSFVLDGNFVFFHPEQFIYGASATNTPSGRVVFDGPVGGVPASGFYRDFSIFVWSDPDAPTAVGQYRKIIAYDGPNLTATVDEDWAVIPSGNATFALCWPDRIWLPVAIVSDPRKAGGTLFPPQNFPTDVPVGSNTIQQQVLLPGLSYLSTIDDYYIGWTLDFLDGVNAGKSVKIIDYVAATKILVTETAVTPPAENDWFRISPPIANNIGVSDNFYKGRWVHIAGATPQDVSYGRKIRTQTRQIVKSKFDPLTTPASHIAYIYDPRTGEGEQFEFPPAPTMLYGISNSYVPLQHLAAYVGIELDELDPEVYQREQISQAYNFHRLRGTRKAMELVCNAFGLDVEIDETASNYSHAPSNELVGPEAAAEVNHRQYNNSEIVPVIKQGLGIDDVPVSYLTSPGSETARIADSDIRLYLSRRNLNIEAFDGEILSRILRKLRAHTPIHVQIIFVGLLTRLQESVDLDEALTCEIRPLFEYELGVAETFIGTPIGTVPIVDAYTIGLDDDVSISTEARYRNLARYGRFGSSVPALARWSRGITLLVE